MEWYMLVKGDSMEYSRFNFKTKKQMEDFCKENEIPLGFSDNLSVLAQSVRIGEKVVKNSLGIHPMEGCDGNADGSCSDLTLRRYKRFANGGLHIQRL
jgi:2,4-dienoyl-CoA reductase (NADPH2)